MSKATNRKKAVSARRKTKSASSASRKGMERPGTRKITVTEVKSEESSVVSAQEIAETVSAEPTAEVKKAQKTLSTNIQIEVKEVKETSPVDVDKDSETAETATKTDIAGELAAADIELPVVEVSPVNVEMPTDPVTAAATESILSLPKDDKPDELSQAVSEASAERIYPTISRGYEDHKLESAIQQTSLTEEEIEKISLAPTIDHFAETLDESLQNITIEQPLAKDIYISKPESNHHEDLLKQEAASRASVIISTRSVRAAKRTKVKPRKKLSAKETKEQAIQKALSSASRQLPAKPRRRERVHFGFRRILLAFSCAAAAVFAIVYFVDLNSPNISLKVAAMQTGIDASYPSYVPRGFSLSDITSENGKITLNFRNSDTGDAFGIIEEQSALDSTALLEKYVKTSYGEDYTIIREQGLTLYVSGSDAAWVNGGVIYKLQTTTGSLTKKQLKAIATSL